MENQKNKGGRPKVSYKCISARIPEPIWPIVKELMDNYRISLKKSKQVKKGKINAINQNSK
jgi:hypothetical protein